MERGGAKLKKNKSITMDVNIKEKQLSQDFLIWYKDTSENYPHRFVYYLDEYAIFKWYGCTIKGPDNILRFTLNSLNGVSHKFDDLDNIEIKIEKPVIKNDMDMEACTFENKPVQISKFRKYDEINRLPIDFAPAASSDSLNRTKYDYLASGDGPHINNRRNETPDIIYHIETTGTIEYNKNVQESEGPFGHKKNRSFILNISYTPIHKSNQEVDYDVREICYRWKNDEKPKCNRNLLVEFE